MANGDYFGADRLRELIQPIESIRQALERLAQNRKLEIMFHDRGWPSAKFMWVN